MPTIKLHIQNQELFIDKPNQKIIANSKGYLKFIVDWIDNTDWEDLWRYVEFTWNRQNYIVALPSFPTKLNVPWQVIQSPGFSVSVFGTDIEITDTKVKIKKRITTNVKGIDVTPSGNLAGQLLEIEDTPEEGSVDILLKAYSYATDAQALAQESKTKADDIETQLNNIQPQLNSVEYISKNYQQFEKDTNDSIENLKKSNENFSSEIKKLQDKNKIQDEKIEELSRGKQTQDNNISDISRAQKDLEKSFEKQNISNKKSFEKIDVRLDNLEDFKDNFFTQKITKDQADFIIPTDFNILQGENTGRIDLSTGQVQPEEADWVYSEFIEITKDNFVSNKVGYYAIFYKKEEEQISFLGSKVITQRASFTRLPNANLLVICALKPNYEDLIIQEEEIYRSYMYCFDEDLTKAVQHIIDNSIGVLLDTEY